MKEAVRNYRATSFGKPAGPWRSNRDDMRKDLIAQNLGSYDDWGTFFITVPGGFETCWQLVAVSAAA